MTREEAIERLEFLKGVYSVDTETALDMAIEALSTDAVSREEYEEVKEEYINTVGAILAVISAPSCLKEVNDLIEPLKAVRCKDCRHRFYDKYNDCFMCENHEYGESFEDDDYCSWGERR